MKRNWRKNTAALIMVVILIVVNACNFPGAEELFGNPQTKYINITEVSVTPEVGGGDFTLTFSYSRQRTGSVSISCNYVAPDGNTYGILTVEDNDATSLTGVTKTQNFSVVKTGDAAAQGTYTATCQDEYGLSRDSDTFTVGDDTSGDVAILDVKVFEGDYYNYELKMVFVIRIPGDVPFTCNYVAPSGGTFSIGNYTGSQRLNEPVSTHLFFSIKPAVGNPEPGTYTATCQDDDLRTTKSTSFVVSEEPTPTPTTTFTPQPLIREATIAYDESNEQMTPHKDQWGFFPSQFHKWCNPILTISPDGTISSSCYNPEDGGDLGFHGTWFNGTIEGTVTGMVDADGRITFKEELTENKDPETSGWSKRVVILEGTGTFSSPTKANGTATFNAECTAARPEGGFCGIESTYDSFTGSIPWELVITGSKQ